MITSSVSSFGNVERNNVPMIAASRGSGAGGCILEVAAQQPGQREAFAIAQLDRGFGAPCLKAGMVRL